MQNGPASLDFSNSNILQLGRALRRCCRVPFHSEVRRSPPDGVRYSGPKDHTTFGLTRKNLTQSRVCPN